MRLRDKVAVITGAGAGIGRATADLFVREGAKVVLGDVDAERLGEAARGLGVACAIAPCDVSREIDCRRLMDTALQAFGRIDILVNNAGMGALGTVVTTDEATWDRVMAVNVKGVYYCSKLAIPIMQAQGGGVIVNTASNVASVGIPDRAAYVASKGAVAALTRAMALDHADANVRVNCVAPGVVMSSYFDRMLAEVPDPAAFKQALADRAPMKRTAEPAEIAHAILFLACDESSFATGSMLTVDGGMTAR
jgi:NAD(P)-dependent dehydrogenase (short-subunit alcohol dehydrogenase family)